MKTCKRRRRLEQRPPEMITKHKLGQIYAKTKKTSQKDFNIVVSEFMKLIGDQYFEKGSMQAVCLSSAMPLEKIMRIW